MIDGSLTADGGTNLMVEVKDWQREASPRRSGACRPRLLVE